ncbi:hypothetical protein Prudu_017406 [Prunus dulcis]|uniref:Uncharacterized protein n=1 Tax=Prunus dulcis TaxID=3755 RepID=A0A4Y1RNH6_PRUDU|nr:hypothetical protein Prudu_017406 [Prunus dulcis]
MDFKRPDPLRHLKSYNGGYDLKNKHYWANSSIRSTCPIKDFLDRHFISIFMLALLFTILAIVASSLALVENQRSMKTTDKLKGAILSQAQNARRTIRKIRGTSCGCSCKLGVVGFSISFAKDTCSALKDFQENSHNSSLSSILPCLDPERSEKLMGQIGYTIHSFINQLNSKVTEIANSLGIDEQNDDLVGLLRICNPFSGPPNYSYMPSSCSDAIPVGKLPEVSRFNYWHKITCYLNDMETCRKSGKLISRASYNMAWAYSHCVQDFLDIYPTLLSLSECSFVKDGISDVVSQHCRPFKTALRLLWASMLSLAIVMVFQDRGRSFTKFAITPCLPP